MTSRLRCVAWLLGVRLLSALPAQAEEFRLFPSNVPPSHFFSDGHATAQFQIAAPVQAPWGTASGEDAPPPENVPQDQTRTAPVPILLRIPEPQPSSAALLTSGVLLGASLYSFSSGWKHGFEGFHFTQEHWFGSNTYAGGADKCSHFIVSASLARELWTLYDRYGLTPAQATAVAFGTTALSGFLIEMGDGISPYGFSWEDFASDALGSAAGVLLTRNSLNDLIGLRAGKVSSGFSAPEETETLGGSYSNEIYSADLKLAGLAARMRRNAGPARFLLLSVTYDTKGFGHQPPLPYRARHVGVAG